jgi:hypothetical protein
MAIVGECQPDTAIWRSINTSSLCRSLSSHMIKDKDYAWAILLCQVTWPSEENVYQVLPKTSTLPLSEGDILHHAKLVFGYWSFTAPFCIMSLMICITAPFCTMSQMKSCKNLLKPHCFTTCDTGCDILHLCYTECYRYLLS